MCYSQKTGGPGNSTTVLSYQVYQLAFTGLYTGMAQRWQSLPLLWWRGGANFLSTLWHVIVPVLRPSIATLFLINLVTSWQEFFLPLIISRSSDSATLTLGITQAEVNPQYQTVACGNEAAMALIVIAPVFILAIIFQKQIIEGLMAGSLKV